ncbi:MAG: hypothetical protein KUG65_11860, partial [Sphingomonadaceae bacterium]|nr:hypothetical protein [Sphingomonadaceae bacterium]
MNSNTETLAGAAAGKPDPAPISTIANPEQGLVQLWRCVFCALLLLAASAWPVAKAHAGTVEQIAEEFAKKVTDDPTLRKEIGNAVEALADTVPNGPEAIRGIKGQAVRPPRGASGPLVELVVNFDKVACAGWLITFRKKIIDLQIARADPAKIAAAQTLYNKVVFGCRKIIDEETYEQIGKAPGTQTEAQPEPEDEQDSGLGYRIRFIDGVLVLSASDAICADKCRKEWLNWKSAVRTRTGTERRITFASDRINDIANSELPGTKRRLAAEKRVLKYYKDKQARRRHGYDPKDAVATTKSEVKISNLETRIKDLAAESKNLEAEVKALGQKMPGLLQTEKAALKAYLDCLKKCKSAADSASDSSDFADKTIGILERRMRIIDRLIKTTNAPKSTQDKRTSYLPGPGTASEHAAMIIPQGGAVVLSQDEVANRAVAISTMRQGLGFPQGNMVQPPYLGMGEDPAYEVRADVDERYRQVENHQMSRRYN